MEDEAGMHVYGHLFMQIYLIFCFFYRQWLPPSKIDTLGVDTNFDHVQVSMSGASKRSVQQAYDRAMRYSKKVKKLNKVVKEDTSNSDNNSCSS